MTLLETEKATKVVIIGAGPAGLTAAYELSKRRVPSVILEKDLEVGGLAKTIVFRGYRFDIGGHRFFTKVNSVERIWQEVLKEDLLLRKRLSRIYYKKKLFYYPLQPFNALFGLGLWNSILIFASYVSARLRPHNPADTFEKWVSNHFGKRLYTIFFKTYTEKVWGIPCSEIRAEWAAQRIKGLSLITLLKNALLKKSDGKAAPVIKTLIDSFYYPRLGPGMMWQKVAELVQMDGSRLLMDVNLQRIRCNSSRIESLEVMQHGKQERVDGTDFISSMPISELVQKLEPRAPEDVLEAAHLLKYRDFLTVSLIVNQAEVFRDNWIYIHDPSVKVGRIQNFKNWSPQMVPDPNKTCLGLEYFCFQHDGLWSMSDHDLIQLAKEELRILGLVQPEDIEDGFVVRIQKAYPVYDSTYPDSLKKIRTFLQRFENLQVVGRNGMHKYNNQDHSMLTAMLAVENIFGEKHDLWTVNVDEEYHEEITDTEKTSEASVGLTRLVPAKVLKSPLDEVLIRTFGRIDKLALALAVGTVVSLIILMSTMWLVLKGGAVVGPNLQLLQQYFLGYTVTVQGALIGMSYGFIWGFLFGWLFAYLRNLSLGIFFYFIKRDSEVSSWKHLLDGI